MSLAEQIAADFSGIVSDFGTSAIVSGKTLVGVLASVESAFALEEGGLGVDITSRFRYDPAAQTGEALGFVPQAGARLSVAGKAFRIAAVKRGDSHGLVTLDLSQQR